MQLLVGVDSPSDHQTKFECPPSSGDESGISLCSCSKDTDTPPKHQQQQVVVGTLKESKIRRISLPIDQHRNTVTKRHVQLLHSLSCNDEAPTWRLWGEEKSDDAIHTVYLKKVRYHHPSRTIAQDSDDDDISHLEWETVRVRLLKAGTLEKLVESLASDSGELESSFVNVFLATYRTFATASQVLNMMLDRYILLSEALPESNYMGLTPELQDCHKRAIRLTLQVWMDTCADDFRDPPLFSSLHQILEFAKQYLPDSDLYIKVNYKLHKMRIEEENKTSSPLLDRILSLEDLRFSGNNSLPHLQNGEFRGTPPPLAPNGLANGIANGIASLLPNGHKFLPAYDFMSMSEVIAAQQLTRMDAVLFHALLPHQCLGSVWSQRDRRMNGGSSPSPTVTATIDQFNAISYRVQSMILVDTELKISQRSKIISKWIDIAQELRMLKNFSSLKAIISSLQSNPIYRLRKTWNAVPKEKFELYEELARIFSEENNQLNQRELLIKEGTAKHAQASNQKDKQITKAIEKMTLNPLSVNHGTIPYLGTFLTDLTMIDNAIADSVGDGLINFEKKRKEFEVLAQIRLLQGAAKSYHFTTDHRFERWWDSVLVLDGKEVFSLSCQIEPDLNTSNSSAPPSVKGNRSKSQCHIKNNSIGGNSIVSSNDSCTISQSDSYSTERKMSTSSTSSLPSMNISLHSAPSLPPSTPEKTPRTSAVGSTVTDGGSPMSPYITHDYYIIKVHLESDNRELQGVNLYKSIYLTNDEKTPSVIEKAMSKHGIEGDPKDYTLAQILPEGAGEMILPPSTNVYYAVKVCSEMQFVLRRRRHGDEDTILRRGPAKDHKQRKKIFLH